jgi:hypothetical protein
VIRDSGDLGYPVMARVRLVVVTTGALSVLWFATACSSATGATAPFPPIAGTYIVPTVTVTLSAPGNPVLVDSFPGGGFSFDSASRSGAFTGTYSIRGILGSMGGQEEADGSLRFSTFGMYQSSSRPPLENDQFIAYVLPMCDWSTASAGEMTGQVVQPAGGAARSLAITGSVRVQCKVSGSASPVTSTVTLTGSGAAQTS